MCVNVNSTYTHDGDIIVDTDINSGVGVIVLQLCQCAFRYTAKNVGGPKCLGVEVNKNALLLRCPLEVLGAALEALHNVPVDHH